MDKYRKLNYNYLPQDNKRYIRYQNPSFSSTLLDQIYRSIDETNDHHVDDEFVFYKGTVMTVKQKHYIHTALAPKNQADFQQIHNWMEKSKGGAKITKTSTEKSAATDHMYQRKNGGKYGNFVNLNSSWSSSDSSSGGLFSSEAESGYGLSSRSSSTNTYRPKPIKTSTDDFKKNLRDEEQDHESGGVFKRSKLKALKIYSDLNKCKLQPISPGAKLASFLNSLFTTGGHGKKGKTSGADSLNTSPACSTSRSCLSKSPGNLSKNNGTKRSVRFYPVSVIVDEDCQPCGHKSLQHGHGINKNIVDTTDHKSNINEELVYHISRKDQSIEEASRTELLEDDDDASYASSDLFELDNLNNDDNGIDVLGKYMEELPVYETTYLDTNRPIANSLVV